MSQVTPYKINSRSKKEQVTDMFNNIAENYDFLNHFLSLGIDKLWRKKAIALLKDTPSGSKILDIATGTADFAIAALKLHPAKITGVDISEKMLDKGREKIKYLNLENKIELTVADSENLPYGDNSFNAITVGFGVRNFEHPEKGLSEMYRVLGIGGAVAILEFSKPKIFPIKQIYNLYFLNVLPLAGKIISKDHRAYTYLPESVRAFPEGASFLEIMQKAGFREIKQIPLSFGIASIYFGIK